jgi:L-alanine-DL-glutamate epimerase-like enolase superfamily enzyme
MLGMKFDSLDQVEEFLMECDGKAPASWVGADEPHTAAWWAVDLALLDCFGHAFQKPARLGALSSFPDSLKYSPVLSAESGFDFLTTLMKVRLYGFRQVKLKLGGKNDLRLGRLVRCVLGGHIEIRADANLGWSVCQNAAREDPVLT